MTINVTIDLSPSELLQAVTDHIQAATRYSYDFPRGEAVAITQISTGYRITWFAHETKPETVDTAKTVTEVIQP